MTDIDIVQNSPQESDWIGTRETRVGQSGSLDSAQPSCYDLGLAGELAVEVAMNQQATLVADDLVKMSLPQLDDLFRRSPAGPIPSGPVDGTVLFDPGSPMAELAAKVAHLLFWKGKVFDPDAGELRNVLLPVGVQAVAAKVYRAPSWLDGNECIVLDYSQTSVIAHWVRDEIRLVAAGLWLGLVYWDRERILGFALANPPKSADIA